MSQIQPLELQWKKCEVTDCMYSYSFSQMMNQYHNHRVARATWNVEWNGMQNGT